MRPRRRSTAWHQPRAGRQPRGGRGGLPASGLIARLTSTPAIIAALWTIWSSSFLAIKLGLTYSSPEVFTVLRVVAATTVLLIVVATRRRSHGGFLGGRGVHRYGVALGATNVTAFMALQNAGLVHAPIGIASVLIYTQPLLVALGAALLLRERLTLRQVLGLVTGWLGVVLLVFGELELGLTPIGSVLLLLASAVAWAAGTLFVKWLPAEVSVWSLLLWQNLYGLLPVSLLAALGTSTATWGVPLFFAMAWAGALAGIGGFGLLFVLLRRGKAGVVTSWIFAVPIIASALGVIVLGETLHPGLFFGGGAVAVGIYLVNSRGRRSGSVDGQSTPV
ncbi:MAG: EamA family transporter [Propionibacteriales bacterium]|nr:EamA family transporter [Propionibacteriales bacterium]